VSCATVSKVDLASGVKTPGLNIWRHEKRLCSHIKYAVLMSAAYPGICILNFFYFTVINTLLYYGVVRCLILIG